MTKCSVRLVISNKHSDIGKITYCLFGTDSVSEGYNILKKW